MAVCALLVACSDAPEGGAPDEQASFERAATAIAYDAEIVGAPSERSEALMREALALFRRRDGGAQSLAFLRRRAQGDIETTKKILKSFGYFEAEVKVEIDEPLEALETPPPLSPPPVDERGSQPEQAPASPVAAVARLVISPGRQFELAEHRFLLLGDEPVESPPDAAALGSPVGAPAAARGILNAETAAVAALRASGRPYAERLGRSAVADTEAATLEVETTIAPGPQYLIGPVAYLGLESVDPEYLDTYIAWGEAEVADPARLVEFQRALVATGLFDAGAAAFPKEPPPGEIAPVVVTLEEAKHRTISGGVRYDTDAGPAVRGGFEHRNLFGANETVTLEALVGLEEQSLDNRYRVPQFGRPGQDLVTGLELRRIDDDAFEEIGGTFALGLERELTPELTVGAGGLIELSRIEDADGKRTSRLFGLPFFAAFDSTEDRLDPTRGVRVRVSATPFTGVVGDTAAAFAILDGTASTYFDLTGERLYILAARARLASALSGDFDVVAANRRLYSGGGGSVRGYRERFIGPLDDDNDPTGGLSAVELGAELRARVSDTIGLAGFVEAGSVSPDVAPTFTDGVQVAAGAGVRYFSPIGPLRVDLGVPLNPRGADDAFQLYISIGQAF